VIAQMCPRWHRQGARAGHQEREGHRSRPDDKISAIRAALAAGNGIRQARRRRQRDGSPDRTGNAGRGIARQHRERSSRFWRRLDAPITHRLTLFACRQRGGRGAVLYTVQVRVDGDNVAAEMSEIWEWLDQNQVDAEVFRYRMTAEDVRLRIEFGALSEASAFAEAFSGSILGVS